MNDLPLEQDLSSEQPVAVKLIGVGGAGCNAVGRLSRDGLTGMQCAALNTDAQALSACPVTEKRVLGASITRGLGAGGDPELGREAAEADRQVMGSLVQGQDLVFLVAGLGGGTGTGATPLVAEAAVEQGALVIAFVTMPFSFEGGRRLKQAEEGLQALRRVCDAVIPLPNDVLLQEGDERESIQASFARSDDWVGRGVKALWGMLQGTGMINVDFSSLRQVFQTRGGRTLFGLGSGAGEKAAEEALQSLRLCPLLTIPENSRKADRLVVNITGGPSLATAKVNEVMQAVTAEYGPDANVLLGAMIDEALGDRLEVMMIGTTDISGRGRGGAVRAPAAVLRPRPAAKAPAVAATPAPAEAASEPAQPAKAQSPAAPKPKPARTAAEEAAQNEFSFGEVEMRGHFENTDRNLFEGQDLDVPTYLRKGIKIVV